jgi:4-alpha-glucanotransferase
VTTHDLPPTRGTWRGEHVRLREKLGLLTRPVAEELAADQAHQAAWLAELRRVGLLGAAPSVEEIVLALYRYLGAHRPSCWRCRWPTPSATCAPRTSRAPPTNTRIGGCR